MRWQPRIFDPTRAIKPNKSSRRIVTELDDKDALSLVGSLNFGNMYLGETRSIWATFVNTGPTILNIQDFTTPSEITYYGTIPSSVNIDDDFKIRLTITPTGLGKHSGKLAFKLRRKTVYFTFTALVIPCGLFYNNIVAYDNSQIYSGIKL